MYSIQDELYSCWFMLFVVKKSLFIDGILSVLVLY